MTPRPVVLAIGGSDSGGGAGIQADLRAIGALGAFGATAVTAVTAQGRRGVEAVHPIPAEVVTAQIEAAFAVHRVSVVKTGMLVNEVIVRAVAASLRTRRSVPVVVDPVFRSSSGHALLDAAGLEAMRQVLFPLATVVTPNLSEAEALAGVSIEGGARAEEVGRLLLALGVPAVVVTGGHRSGEPRDVLVTAEACWEIPGRRVEIGRTHGTGCTHAAALAAALAGGADLREAARLAKDLVERGLRHAHRLVGDTAVPDPPHGER